MSDKKLARFFLLLAVEVSTIVVGFAAVNFYVLPRNVNIRAYDWFLFEGIFCMVFSILLALGRGGIDAYTARSAATVAATDAIYDKEYKVSEVFRKDKWKPEGFPKAALVLLIVGIMFLLIYFLTL